VPVTYEWMNEWMNEWVSEWMSAWMSVVNVRVKSERHTKPLLGTSRKEGIEVNAKITGYMFMS